MSALVFKDPGQEALAILARHDVAVLPVPVEKIMKAEGLAVRYAPLAADMSGMSFVKEEQRVVVVNSLHHPNRQRFTLAHEYGHHVLDAELLRSGVHVDKVVLHRGELAAQGTDDIEIRANRFASEILMPEALIRPLAEGLMDWNDEAGLTRLAQKCKVSLAALQYRLARL